MPNRTASLSAAAAVLLLTWAGGMVHADTDLPHYTAHRAGSPIVIDGRLDEKAWQNAATFGDFHFPWWKEGKKEQTVARMLWDDKHLYVAYDCRDAHVSAVHTEHDSKVYLDDCVELFTAPNPERPLEYFNIEMNVNRAVLDRHHPDGPGKPQTPNWTAEGIQIATRVDGTLNDDSDTDRGWVLEVAIPFACFEPATGRAHPRDGDVWHLNLNRLGGKTNPQHSQWSPGKTEQPAFHTPETFGRVTFSAKTPAEQALAELARAGYVPVADFPQMPADFAPGQCSAVVINSREEVYLLHRGKTRPIMCFDRSGKFLHSWGDELISGAHGMRLDAEENVWVTDIVHHLVYKFSPAGKLLLALGTADRPGTATSQFDRPADVAFAPNGDIFVADGYGNSRVMRFDKNGKFLTAWGTPGKGPGEFDVPHCVLLDADQRVIVGDRENDRIQVFDMDGKRLAIWEGFAPYGIALDARQRLFVADARASQILRVNLSGEVEQRFGSFGQAPGQFNLPHMLAIDQEGSLYVAEVGGKRLQKFRLIQPVP
ncbi:MAG: 6-bladed beta-propeller, partial [Planctomycetaceae bacterium]|nr:6-bladed beta-propeller [Planctomycetaceae bacterium]